MRELLEGIASARILIVDDRPGNVVLLQTILREAGYENVQSTTDSRAVMGLYHANDFDLILLDIRMPHLNGLEIMELLSQERKDDYLPVLILTAESDMNTRIRALQAGARDFVTKPFDTAEVLNRISNMLEVRALYNERTRQNEILEEKVRQRTLELEVRNRKLEETSLDIINRLGRAGEYRDNQTGGHVMRMSHYCHRLALAAGLGEKRAELILQASPMHDLGKIATPDSILLKPGKLDDNEWDVMQTHAAIGAEILSNHDSELLRMAQSIALTHHESWDGTGYPRQLAGEEIPIEGRITTVCDVFDALTSERPYKKAWTIDDSVAYLNEQSARIFDPDLVSLFNEVLPDILEIRQQFADLN